MGVTPVRLASEANSRTGQLLSNLYMRAPVQLELLAYADDEELDGGCHDPWRNVV